MALWLHFESPQTQQAAGKVGPSGAVCPSLPLPCPGGDYSIPGLVLAGEEEEFSVLGAISVR